MGDPAERGGHPGALVEARSLVVAHPALHAGDAGERPLQGPRAEPVDQTALLRDDDELVRIARIAGLDEQVASSALADESLDEAVQLSVSTASSLGIQGVPFYVIDDRYGISGAQPAEAFVQALTQVWQEKQATPAPLLLPMADAGEACGPEGC